MQNVRFVLTGGANDIFFMNVMSYHLDGAQCDVVSLDEKTNILEHQY